MEAAVARVRARLQSGLAPRGVWWCVGGKWGYWCACGRCFTRKHHLLEHQRVRKHVCWCGYTSYRGLARHRRVHGGRDFACTECDSKFKTAGTRKTHMLVHSAKSLACPHCDKAFKRREVLLTHLELVHGVGKLVCPCCKECVSALRLLAGRGVCRTCYHRATTVSADEWAMYLDDFLGTDGLVSEDATLKSLGGRSRRRPDRLYERVGHVEVDECDGHEHAYYRGEDERLQEIQGDPFVAGRPVVVTRYNSDKPNLELLVAVKKHIRALPHHPPLSVYYVGYERAVSTELVSFFITSGEDLTR